MVEMLETSLSSIEIVCWSDAEEIVHTSFHFMENPRGRVQGNMWQIFLILANIKYIFIVHCILRHIIPARIAQVTGFQFGDTCKETILNIFTMKHISPNS